MRIFLRLLGVCLLMLVPFFACMDFGSDEGQGSGCGPYNFTWGEPDPCRGVVCADDGDPCTVEYCSGGSCRSRPADDGTVCTYDGLRGVCVEGICGENLCEDVVCDEPCSSGFCDFADGLCHYEPRLADGTPCVFDGLEGVCVGGVCGENLCEEVVCDEEPCRMGVCSYVDGSCSYADNKPIGTPCVFEGNPGVCIDGICGENLCEGVDCDDGDACTDGTCDYRDGTCDFTSVVCADEEPCTEDTCDPTEGCVFTRVEDGSPCGSGMCQAGQCVPPCDPEASDVYECPIVGLEDQICCPSYQYCRESCAEYEQDFDSLDIASPTALSSDGWITFANVFAQDGTTLMYSYGHFLAPNDSFRFCAIVSGDEGAEQGNYHLLIVSDYSNVHEQAAGHFVEANTYREREIIAEDVGTILEFHFDARRGDINDPSHPGCAETPEPPCDSTANAFFRTVDPKIGYPVTNEVLKDTTDLTTSWSRYSIELEIDESMEGQLLQFGFSATASSFEPSGTLYDNVVMKREMP